MQVVRDLSRFLMVLKTAVTGLGRELGLLVSPYVDGDTARPLRVQLLRVAVVTPKYAAVRRVQSTTVPSSKYSSAFSVIAGGHRAGPGTGAAGVALCGRRHRPAAEP